MEKWKSFTSKMPVHPSALSQKHPQFTSSDRRLEHINLVSSAFQGTQGKIAST
jgi:hypothetical protein